MKSVLQIDLYKRLEWLTPFSQNTPRHTTLHTTNTFSSKPLSSLAGPRSQTIHSHLSNILPATTMRCIFAAIALAFAVLVTIFTTTVKAQGVLPHRAYFQVRVVAEQEHEAALTSSHCTGRSSPADEQSSPIHSRARRL